MSKAALHFASAAKRVTMQPVVNEVLNERARIRRLQAEIDSLRQQLVSFLKQHAARLDAFRQSRADEVSLNESLEACSPLGSLCGGVAVLSNDAVCDVLVW